MKPASCGLFCSDRQPDVFNENVVARGSLGCARAALICHERLRDCAKAWMSKITQFVYTKNFAATINYFVTRQFSAAINIFQ